MFEVGAVHSLCAIKHKCEKWIYECKKNYLANQILSWHDIQIGAYVCMLIFFSFLRTSLDMYLDCSQNPQLLTLNVFQWGKSIISQKAV